MSESRVAVAVRIRPLLGKEKVDRCTSCVEVLSDTELLMGGDKQFTFDHVYSSSSEQVQVYENSVAPLVENFVNGYNTTVLAYGQTGSGKTFTMGSGCGDLGTAGGGGNEAMLGIIPRATAHVFDLISQRRASSPSLEFYLRVQFLELYGENLRDLLDPVGTARGKVVSIRDGPNDSLQVVGATEDSVKCPSDMMDLLDRGTLCRTTGSTDMNSHSSRSHAIFTIILEQHLKGAAETGEGGEGGGEEEDTEYRISKFHFVDLAGSERAKRTRATGQRLKEGININMGLLALGNVISALGAEEAATMNRFVPYRDSKLTRMLQDSLGGNSRTLMIACVSPADSNFEETLNALRYANRARNIKNRAIINRDPKASQIAALKAQIAELKLQILSNNQQQQMGEDFTADTSFSTCTPQLSMVKFPASSGSTTGERQRFLEAEVSRLAELYDQERRARNDLQDRCLVLEAERVALLGLDAQEDEEEEDEDADVAAAAAAAEEEQSLLLAALAEEEEADSGCGGRTSSAEQGATPGTASGEDEDGSVELQHKFAKSQKYLRRIVNKYDETLKSKQDAMAQIVEERAKYEALKVHFESKMAEMNEEVRETQHQRDALESKLRALESLEHSKQTDTSKSEALKLRGQLAEKDKRLRELEDRTRQLNEARKAAAEWQKKESVVRLEIEHFKREKVEYQRKLNDNQKRYIEELKERRLEIAGLKRERARLEQDTHKLTAQTDRDLKLIQQKSEQVAAMQRKLREAQRLTAHPQALSEREKKQRLEIERLASLQVKREEELLDLRRALAKKEDAISRRDRLLAQLEKLRHPIIVTTATSASPQQVTIQELVPEATEEDVRELEQRLEAADSEIIFRDMKCREVLEKDYGAPVADSDSANSAAEGEQLLTVNFTSLDQAREVCQVLMQMFVESKRELRERKNELAKARDQFFTQDQKVKIERRRTETLLGGSVAACSPNSKRQPLSRAVVAASTTATTASLSSSPASAAVMTTPTRMQDSLNLSLSDASLEDEPFAVAPKTPERLERKARDVMDSEVRIKSMEATLRSLRVEDASSSTRRRTSPSASNASVGPPTQQPLLLPPQQTATTRRGSQSWESVVNRLTSPSNATGIHKYGRRTSQLLPAIHSAPHYYNEEDGGDGNGRRGGGVAAAAAAAARRQLNLAHSHPMRSAVPATAVTAGGGSFAQAAEEGTGDEQQAHSTATTAAASKFVARMDAVASSSPRLMPGANIALLPPSGPAPAPPTASVAAESSYMRMTESQRNKQHLDAEARKSNSLFILQRGYTRTSPPPTRSGVVSKASVLPPFLSNTAAVVVPGKENALHKTLADERKRRRNRLTTPSASTTAASTSPATTTTTNMDGSV